MPRVLLTVGTLVLAAVVYALMLHGWRSRQRRQGDLPPPPAAPAEPGTVLVAATPGLFVGTTYTGRWMDRVAVHSLSDRASSWLSVATDGVHLDREGLPELFLPFDLIEAAGLEEALAGKVVSGGMLALTWRLGPARVTSGFRAADRSAHARLVDVVSAQLAAAP